MFQPHHQRTSWKTWLFQLLISAIVIGFVRYGINRKIHPERYEKTQTQTQASTEIEENERNEVIAGGIVLKADKNGHFGGTALINGVPMKYLIDTGATLVSVPANMANGTLKAGKPYITHTANGEAIAYQTTISSLKIGNAEIKNVDAGINEKLDEVLIGMSALKNFIMSKDKDTLTLIAYNTPADIGNVAMNLQNSSSNEKKLDTDTKKTIEWKKIVTCDKNGEGCKTHYTAAN